MIPRLIGMVHLGPLPGSPGFESLDDVLASAASDARILQEAGLDAVVVENLGDIPYYADDVPKVTVAAMTRAITEVAGATSLPVGVNVLRNDAVAALAVAAATGAAFIRVNVLAGVMYTDQGLITGRAAELARARRAWAPDVAIYADVFVKHAVPPAGASLERAAEDLVERAAADALIVSGPATGEQPEHGALESVRAAAPDTPLLVGSGADAGNVAALLSVADGVIVGTSLKVGRVSSGPVDPESARSFVAAAG